MTRGVPGILIVSNLGEIPAADRRAYLDLYKMPPDSLIISDVSQARGFIIDDDTIIQRSYKAQGFEHMETEEILKSLRRPPSAAPDENGIPMEPRLTSDDPSFGSW